MDISPDESISASAPILHVIVVGFHHKKGCQVEYVYPPFPDDSSNTTECPEGWKYLPTLALPDGSHNYTQDTIYFHLPSLLDSDQTVYGISCYRQIPIDKVKNRTSDLTRSTVQKAVCVLSVIPLYGHIEVKMSLITHAYFEEGDFTKVSILKDTYDHLNMCLQDIENFQTKQQFFIGLSARDFILKFRHKALLLFKLLLLERRLIFYCTPVQTLSSTILTLLSLHPGMLEEGLHQSACFQPSHPTSPIPNFFEKNEMNFPRGNENDGSRIATPVRDYSNLNVVFTRFNVDDLEDTAASILMEQRGGDECARSKNVVSFQDEEMDPLGDVTIKTNLSLISKLDIASCGTPLQIFTHGYLCLPYLSLPYMDVLGDPNVRGYVVGATNVLFKQKKNLADILIEVDTAKIETSDTELKRLLHLTMEDLRFADYIVKHVSEEKQDIFTDGVGWEGGDEWIRTQFKIYLLSLMRMSLLPENSREIEQFNAAFVSAWKDTNNYKMWVGDLYEPLREINPCHPFARQLSVADMKLKLSHTLQCTEGGRKLNQAVANTSRAVATTGRAVGGAFSQARGAVSSWLTNLINVPPTSASPDSMDQTMYPKSTNGSCDFEQDTDF